MLVLTGNRPWYAMRRYHLLSALFGVNWRIRDLLDHKSAYAQFTFQKNVSDVNAETEQEK